MRGPCCHMAHKWAPRSCDVVHTSIIQSTVQRLVGSGSVATAFGPIRAGMITKPVSCNLRFNIMNKPIVILLHKYRDMLETCVALQELLQKVHFATLLSIQEGAERTYAAVVSSAEAFIQCVGVCTDYKPAIGNDAYLLVFDPLANFCPLRQLA